MLQPIHRGHRIGYRLLLASALLALIVIDSATAQTAAFTYQGKLNDNGNPASGPHDFQFKLFDTATVGTGMQHGSTIDVPNVSVTAGIFTVQLDFGAAVFPGADRYLEISVRPAGGGAFTMLAPRQAVTSTPYALRSTTAGTADMATNATQLGGLTSSGFIQNTTSQQASTDFNIGGTGTANILNATSQFNLGGFRVMSQPGPGGNLFVGRFAGANSTAADNSFFGIAAGSSTTTGAGNSFFGASTGFTNTTGSNNSYFGLSAGTALMGSGNSFFGKRSGGNISGDGDNNTFIGIETNFDLSGGTGSNNTLLGANSKVDFTASGQVINFATAIGAGAIVNASNTLVLGRSADTVQVPGTLDIIGTFSANILNATTQYNLGGSRILSNAGTNNLFVGINAGAGNTTGIRNSFFGSNAGQSNTTSCCNAYFGTDAGVNSTGEGNTFFGYLAGGLNTTGSNNIFIGALAGNLDFGTQVSNSIVIGVNAAVSTSNTIILGDSSHTTEIPGNLRAGDLGSGNFRLETVSSQIGGGIVAGNLYIRQLNQPGSPAHLCWRAATDGVSALLVTTCTTSSSSSLYKTDSEPFTGGLNIINRLNPIMFRWKEGGKRDFGLNADDVAEVEPLLVTRNAKGEVEDVKHENMMVVFINAFKQQQAQIKSLQQEIETLMKRQQELDGLKALVCADRPDASVCKSN